MECVKLWRDLATVSGHPVREWSVKDEKWWYRPIGKPLRDDLICEHLTHGEDFRTIWLNLGSENDPERLRNTRCLIFGIDDHNMRMTVGEVLCAAITRRLCPDRR